METSATVMATASGVVGDVYQAMAKTYASGGLDALVRQHGLVLMTVLLAGIVMILLLLVLLMPAKRKVVVRRRVRVSRQAIASERVAPARTEVQAQADSGQTSGGRWPIAAMVAAMVVIAAFAATYVMTGTDRYCALTCHARANGVTAALKHTHAPCVSCHEGGPISAAGSRARMLAVYALSTEPTATPYPIDPSRCLACHGNIEVETVATKTGLRMSHKEVIAKGFACGDCHASVGHTEGSSLSASMDQCIPCHDGKQASSECGACHVGGSPLARRRTIETASFTYAPVQVANRDCKRCHGLNKRCMNCHNGLLMPHPDDFGSGGHGRIAAFDGKERCYKCHALAWCTAKCHHDFSAHDPVKWRKGHQSGTSEQCGSCHIAWDGKGNWCDVCHE